MSRSKGIAYPPGEVLNPILGKTDYSYVILWMLNNNDHCEWSDFVAEISESTLSAHLRKLMNKGFVTKPERNKYKITSSGKDRFNELTYDMKVGKKQLKYPPKAILKKRNYDHWILWMLYNNYSCKWSEFKQEPLSINQSALSNNINQLIEEGYIERENKKYIITPLGKSEYFTILKQYDLDRQSILEQQSKRIEEITGKTSEFFQKYNIQDNQLKFRYIDYVLKLNYSKVVSTLKDEEDFNKILLFLAFNHPNQYPEYISPKEFSNKYNIKIEILNYYVLEIVNNQFFKVKFFTLSDNQGRIYYFQKNEPLEKILNAITEKYITQFTYLNKFQDKPALDIELLLEDIVGDICGSLFDDNLKNSLKRFLPDYIKYLAYNIESEKKLVDKEERLEGFVWQNIYEEFQTFKPSTTPIKSGEIAEISYVLNKDIFQILDIVYLSKLRFLNTNEVQNSYDLKSIKNFDKLCKLLYRNKYLKANEVCQNIIENVKISELQALILEDLIKTNERSFDESIKLCSKIIKNYPGEFIGYLLLSLTYFYMDKYDASLKTVESGLKKTKHVLLLSQKAQLLIKQHRGDEIIDSLDEAISNYPNCAPLSRIKFLQFLTNWYDHTESMKNPLKVIESAIKLSPDDKELIILKCIFFFLVNNFKEGKKFLVDSIEFNLFKKNPKIDIAVLFLLTFYYTTRGKFDKAIKIADQAIEFYPDYPIPYLAKAIAIGYNLIYKIKISAPNLNIFLELIDIALSLESLRYKKAGYLLLKTTVLHGIKHYEEAFSTIDSAIELIPELKNLHRKKIFYLMEAKREEEVLEIIRKLAVKYPELKMRLYKQKSHLLFTLERFQEGLDTCEEIIKMMPNDPDNYNNKAMFLIYLNRLEEAQKTIEYAIKLNPTVGSYHDTFGEIYFVSGEYEKAIEKFKYSLEVEPLGTYNCHTCLRIGESYQKLKNYEKAFEYYQLGKERSDRTVPTFRESYLEQTENYLTQLKEIMEKEK